MAGGRDPGQRVYHPAILINSTAKVGNCEVGNYRSYSGPGIGGVFKLY